MDILIKNATLISMAEDREKIEDKVNIVIENNKIKSISTIIPQNITNNTVVIDATNKVVMPGLINTHSHVPMSIFRETVDGYDLDTWLTKKIWPMEDKLTADDIYYASLLSFIEMIKNGCTTINDMYFMGNCIINAMKRTGVRLQTTRALMNMISDEDGEARFDEIMNLKKKYGEDSNLSFNAGIHGLYTSTEPYIKKCVEFAKNNNFLVHMHFCEDSKEVQNIIDRYKDTPTNVLLRNFQEVPVLLAHAVKLSKEEISQISQLNVSISHCPISNLKLGCGVADVAEMLKNNINVSLGTDGQGSGCSFDMFEVMKFTALLQKGINEDPEILNAYEVLKMATINGAKALRMDNVIGSIEEGKYADLIIVNMDRVTAKPKNNIISQLVYNTKGQDVETTIINGKILMQDYKLKLEGIQEEKIYEECEKIIKRIS